MKTAVSVPDRLFRAAVQHARRAQKTRSQLYADALAEYRARHVPDEVTSAMNLVVDQVAATPDAAEEAAGDAAFVAAAARRGLERSAW